MPLKPPARTRDILELLRLLDVDAGLAELLERVNWSGVTPRQIYLSVLNRLPESAEMSVPPADYSPLGHAEAALLSPEFQGTILNRVLVAYPEKQRLLFVHVPKCAGTDLIENLSASRPWLYEDMAKREWTSPDALMALLKQFAIRVGAADSIFVSGHIPLRWYIDHNLYRHGDRLFTVVRQPQDVILSQVNYVFKRFFEAPRCRHPDTREWADLLGMDMFDRDMPESELRKLGFRILSHPQIVTANYLCSCLGEDTAASAIEMMARCDIEITDTAHYNDWLRQSWGIESSSHANKSVPIIRTADLDAGQRNHVAQLCREDLKLYDRITTRMAQRRDTRIFGPELV